MYSCCSDVEVQRDPEDNSCTTGIQLLLNRIKKILYTYMYMCRSQALLISKAITVLLSSGKSLPSLMLSPSPSLPLPLVERQDLVELFIESVTLRQSVQDASLKILPDLFRLSKKLQQGKGTLQV